MLCESPLQIPASKKSMTWHSGIGGVAKYGDLIGPVSPRDALENSIVVKWYLTMLMTITR